MTAPGRIDLGRAAPDGSTLIDLDLARDEPELSRPWRQTALGSLAPRSWLAAGLVALVLLPLAGSAAPAPGLVHLWALPASDPHSFHLTSDQERLFAVEPDDDGAELAAYRLADGEQLWRVRPSALRPEPEGQLSIQLSWHADTVLVTHLDNVGGWIAGYDPATGQQRWEAPGWTEVLDIHGHHALMSRPTPEASDLPWYVEPPRALLLFDLAAAEPVATTELEGDTLGLIGYGQHGEPQLITLRSDGELRQLDPVTGRTLASTEADAFSQRPALSVRGEQLLVAGTESGAGLVVYDLITLTEQWRVPDTVWASECGPWWCLGFRFDVSGRVEVVDPASGDRQWTEECEPPIAGVLCLVSVVEQAPDRLWVWRWWSSPTDDAADAPPPESRLLDAGTGQELARLGEWEPVADVESPHQLAFRVGPRAASGARDFGFGEPTRYWVGYLGADLRVRLAGEIEASDVSLSGAYLLARIDDRLEVWQLR